jgi:hypothetical protein
MLDNLHQIYHYIKKWVYSIGMKVFHSLHQSIKNLSDNPNNLNQP